MSDLARLSPTRGGLRGIRAAVLTVPAVGSAAVAHALADGCDSLLAIVLVATACWPSAVALLGRQRGTTALLGWVLLAQAMMHVALEATCADVASGQVSFAAHLQHSLTGSMLAAHAVAAVLMAALLGRADAGLWTARALLRLARASARALGGLRLAPAHVPAEPPSGFVRADAVRVDSIWKSSPGAVRGPPAARAA